MATKISHNFRKFFFGVVIPEMIKIPFPLRYQNPFTGDWFLADLSKIPDKEIYNFLKMINPYYPKYLGLSPISTTELTSEQMTKHIQWIERWASENGVTFGYILEEWEKIVSQYR
jgi:hypothetical protein